MITPRRTELVRVRDLRAFRESIAVRSSRSPSSACAILLPSRSAARQMARVLRQKGIPPPLLLTRDQLYDELHGRLAKPPRRLNLFERDAIAQAAASRASSDGPPLSFRIRPALVAEMIRFYDHLRRQGQGVKRFEELMDQALSGDVHIDRGAERMLGQTRFLASTFREYERQVLETGACDEHGLRERLMAEASSNPLRRLVVTVADWIADPDGLFMADFDLLTRIAGLESLDLVCTEEVLRSGFHERIHQWLPGIEETTPEALPDARPKLLAPQDGNGGRPWFLYRDREDELLAVGRFLKANGGELSHQAVVFKRPLPYLYLAPDTLGAMGMAYHTSDALPLAAEPTIAALDLVLELVEANFTRDAVIALLESPYLLVPEDVSREGIAALNRALSDLRYLGDLSRFEAFREVLARKYPEAMAAYDAALAFGRELAPLLESATASQHIRRLLACLAGHASAISDLSPFASRERRARSALFQLLESLAGAHEGHHDPAWTIGDLALALRRWIQEETFAPGEQVEKAGETEGVHLLDDRAARYGEFENLTLVGLIENDWPERPRRNIFYPPTLLKVLGWPSERDRRGAADARFVDLLRSPSSRVRLSTFTLDEETLVNRSLQLEEISRAGLELTRVGQDSVIGQEFSPASGPATAWLELRMDRTPGEAPEFHGAAGPQPPKVWSISALETYLGCPFKFFAHYVLRLSEEPDDEEVMDPRREGQLVHAVFEAFFRAWQKPGRGAITPKNIDEARAVFSEVVETSLEGLPEAEAGVQRTRLLGSPAAAGLGEAIFRMEAERPTEVIMRLLEYPLRGEFEIATESGPRSVTLSGKADRLDLLADGTFRVIDYKLGWPPDKGKALQLPIYGLCAGVQLQREQRRQWTLDEAAYVAFKGPRRIVPLFTTPASRDEVLSKAQQRLADTLDAIEGGSFPPTPDDVSRCKTCSFTSVCRKDYVGE